MARGWISGQDPITFDPNDALFQSNGLALFLLQVLIILALCYILGFAFQRIGQPKVVGELLAGVLLGPTAFGNIPGFSSTIVPTVSLPLLRLTSNIGLIFFILLVGLETDTDMIKRYARQVALIALPGMAIPFAASVGVAQLLYEKSTDQSVPFTTFMLFIATVMAVTSLSVLSRVISEMQLVTTLLGSVTIAAGALNDLMGYILLALGSALASGGKQINALYELLVALALFLLQWLIIRPFMFWMIRRSNFDLHGSSSRDRVPDYLLVFTLMGALISAFVTEACGLHPILGPLLFGIACPHDNFAVMVTEEIEVVSVQILLPLYFVTSGLNADFKLLNSGLIWGELFLVFFVVWISKYAATSISTRLAGFTWRESVFVAALMQSKSIIELIILNAGREQGVLNAQIYSMLFVTFILSTLTVRPLALFLWKGAQGSESSTAESDAAIFQPSFKDEEEKSRQSAQIGMHGDLDFQPIPVTVAFTFASPPVEALTAFFQLAARKSKAREGGQKNVVLFDVLRFLYNDNSTSNILRFLALQGDQVLEALKLIMKLHLVQTVNHSELGLRDLLTVGSPEEAFQALRMRRAVLENHHPQAETAGARNNELGQSLVLMPWEGNLHLASNQSISSQRENDDQQQLQKSDSGRFASVDSITIQLFQQVRGAASGVLLEPASVLHGRRKHLFRARNCQHESQLGLSSGAARKPRIVVPFFGGSDDRAAVDLARRFARSGSVEGIVITIGKGETPPLDDIKKGLEDLMASHTSQTKSNSDARHLRSATQTSEQQREDVNNLTVNLQTVNVQTEQRADMRALFGERAGAQDGGEEHRESPSIEIETARSPPASEDTTIKQADGITYVTLSVSDIQATRTKTPVEAILSYAAPLLHAQAGDMLFLGRGKLHQRTGDFRLQVQALRQALLEAQGQTSNNITNRADEERALHRVGRVLGASCEAALDFGLSANMLILQSAHASA